MKTAYLSDFRRVDAPYRLAQGLSIEWLVKNRARVSSKLSARMIERFSCSPDKIHKRGSFLKDYLMNDPAEMKVLGDARASLSTRSDFFQEQAVDAFRSWYPDRTSLPSRILHVSCTGYISPSGAQVRVSQLEAGKNVSVHHVYHMGCYAAVPAIEIAEGFVKNGMTSVDIAHTELCSLHVDLTNDEPEQLVVQSLFADGMINYRCSSVKPQKGFEVLTTQDWIASDSLRDMTWAPAEYGFKMTLSREVPTRIKDSLREFVDEIIKKAKVASEKIVFAIHPGGPKIIDEVQEVLGLESTQIQASRWVMQNYGNMSSCTLPHIWQRMMDQEYQSGQCIVSLAFGPGLTIASNILRMV